jgi:hypothetical protein
MKLIITLTLRARRPDNLGLILGGDRHLRMRATPVSSCVLFT